ncbi:hypothetical protein ACFX2I_006224 [Malus domestica]
MGDPMKKKTATDQPRSIDSNCLTTAAREVRLSRALPLPPPTPLCQMLNCSSRRRTAAMASISTFASAWSEFARNVSGEWDGHGADFTREGCPIELPENVVPTAYRESEVKVFDWQTQCPTLANPDEHTLLHKNIDLLPAVGCEADADTQ